MSRKLLSLVLLMLILVSFDINAQYDARRIPVILDNEYYLEPPVSIKSKAQIYWPTSEFPKNLDKKFKAERLLSDDGIELIPVTTAPGQSENWIALDPNNPDIIVSGSNDFRYNGNGGQYKMGAYYSKDGGLTWSESTTPNNLGLYIEWPGNGFGMTNFDPGVTFDDEGNCYYCYGFAVTGGDDHHDNGVFVTKSEDGGKSWNEPVPVALEYGNDEFFHDRYMIVADNMSDNDGLRGNIYVAWKLFPKSSSNQYGIVLSKSTNGGESWSNYDIINGARTYSSQAPTPVIGPHGELYVAWRDGSGTITDAKVQKSTDGGDSWWPSPKNPMTVRNTGTLNSTSGRYVLADKGDARISSYPAIAVDASDGDYSGYVYVIQSGKDDTYTDINGLYFTKSEDGGEHWTDKKRIDNNELGNDIFMPSATVDPVTGTLAVLYYSSQNDPNNQKTDAYVAISDDGGETFSHVRLTPSRTVRTNYQGEGNYYWGDYTGITSYGGKIYPSFWMPSENGSFWSLYSYTAILSPVPNAPENLSYTTNNSPLHITLNWDDPKKNGLGIDLEEFDILIYRNGNLIGTVDNSVQTFTDTDIVADQAYNYFIKAKVNDKLVSDIIYITAIAGGHREPKAPEDFTFSLNGGSVNLEWANPALHVDNTNFYDFAEIRIYLDGELYKTLNADENNLVAGEGAAYELSGLEADKFYEVTISAAGSRNGELTESVFSDVVLIYVGQSFETISEDFEENSISMPFFTKHWAIVDALGKKALHDSPDGDYERNLYNSFIIGPVTVSGDDTTLSMNLIPLIYTNDYSNICVSTDLKEWKALMHFNLNSFDGFESDLEDNSWYPVHVNLADYRDESVFIRLAVSSDNIIQKDGLYIDDMIIDSEPAGIDEFLSENLELNISPNPATENAALHMELPVQGHTMIAVYDNMGRHLFNVENNILAPGSYDFPMDFNNLSAGTYYCRVTIDKLNRTLPIIISK